MNKSGSERVKIYRQNTSTERLEIIGISKELKLLFKNIPGIENVTNADKLKTLIDYWITGHSTQLTVKPVNKPEPNYLKLGKIVKPAAPIPVKESYPVNNTVKIQDWNKFSKDFSNFLFDFKASNRLRPMLRSQGKRSRIALEANQDFKAAFRKICDKLPESILKFFKPMYLQGYFYLYEKEIIEISQQESNDKILLVLFESLRHMGRDEPVKEAKKVLGLGYPKIDR